MMEEDVCSNEPLLQTEEKRSKQRWLWRRLIPLVALLSFTISTIIALVFYFILFSQPSLAEHGYTSTMLPGLKIPPREFPYSARYKPYVNVCLCLSSWFGFEIL